jgi:hypothetical protein
VAVGGGVAVGVAVGVGLGVGVGVPPPQGLCSYEPMLGGLQRGLPSRSIVMPPMVMPAPTAGDPPLNRRSLDEKNCGLALIELRSPCVEARQAARVV